MRDFIDFINDEDGQGMVEYGLALALIAIACISALFIFGKQVNSFYENKVLNDALESAGAN
ncbi:MAG: Flp family type IVb pilin [Lachnospiraceae bacterium]|nr:Flp family type IVb pilin [Lachnospiraceae bacterium]